MPRRAELALALLLAAAANASASGPRWVTGPPYFTAPAGTPVVWSTAHLLYFTDPGDLSASVNHAAADALVAAAAGVWNVPTSTLVVAQGGVLAERVSGANTYPGSNGPVFPEDVQAGNDAAMQIAVIYDSDGSITDILLGSGASSPVECRQNGVTESVDAITPAGFIQHAILVLNGRCTGTAPEQQLQLQYQLERAFGRILGVGWSQTNDNVFTRTPQPTATQAQHWPIMHPIDIVCGAYTYQCLPQPFTLRDDDVAAISALYPTGLVTDPSAAPPAPGKIWTYTQASRVYGTVTFPTGEGMQGVNVLVRRQQGGWNIPEAWYDTSSVSGFRFQQNAGNAVTGAGTGVAASQGSTDPQWQGYYDLAWIPDIDPPGAQNGGMFVVVSTEAINPLYTGAYAVGPYVLGSVEPSGTAANVLMNRYALGPYTYGGAAEVQDFAPGDAVGNCATGGDGVERSPQPVEAGGWWSGVLCGRGHAAWSSFAAAAGRTATIEVTALDEAGLATTAKTMPLVGVWAATDATGTLPTVAATPSAFNSVALGMTTVRLATAQAEALRFVIADARGDGRPDFAYSARVLYADSVAPATVSLNGGQIMITGMGFRADNTVEVNGVPALVTSWTANTIVAVAPSASMEAVDVEVKDLATGGSTVMTRALTYANIVPDAMTLVSAPLGVVPVGTPASVPFAVRVLLGDGVTPVAGLPVTFSVAAGSARFSVCSAVPCIVLTDATGLAATLVTPTVFGTVTVLAAAVGATQTATFEAVARSITAVNPVEYIAAGAAVTWTPVVSVVENGALAAGVGVVWTTSGAMTISPAASQTSAFGIAQASAVAGPLTAGAQASAQACAWVTVCDGFTAVGVDPSAWRLEVVSGAGQSVQSSATFAPVVVVVTDASGNPVAGAAVVVHQTVAATEMACPTRGRCPMAPVLAAAQAPAVSDADGLVSVVPLQIAGTAGVTNIAVAAGTQGFVGLSLQPLP